MFIAAQFTRAKTRKKPTCLWIIITDKEDVVCVCVCVCVCKMKYYLVVEKNEIMPSVATWMDLEIIIQSKVRNRKTNTI